MTLNRALQSYWASVNELTMCELYVNGSDACAYVKYPELERFAELETYQALYDNDENRLYITFLEREAEKFIKIKNIGCKTVADAVKREIDNGNVKEDTVIEICGRTRVKERCTVADVEKYNEIEIEDYCFWPADSLEDDCLCIICNEKQLYGDEDEEG